MLLVGGDSFGRFDEQNLHWAKIISNGKAKSVAIGGRDISTTSYATMQELYKGNYTHCIFFITSFGRIGMQTNKQNEIDIVDKVIVKTPTEDYSKPTINDKSPYWSMNIHGGTMHKVGGLSFFNEEILMENLQENSNADFLFKSIPDFAFTHDRLGNLALIKNYCQIHNIKLIFATNFQDTEWRKAVKEFLDINLFDLGQLEHLGPAILHDSIIFQTLPSHYNTKQHKEFAELFNKEFVNWIN